MEKTSKELLQFEHNHPSSSKEAALLVCKNGRTSLEEKPKPGWKPFIASLPRSQVLGKVKDFLGVISEANKTLQLNAKDKPEEYDIEVLKGNESEYIEMDLMMGVADLHTSEAVAAAEAAVVGNQPVFNLLANGSYSESERSSDDDDNDDKDEDDDNNKDDRRKTQSKGRLKSKRPKIVELL